MEAVRWGIISTADINRKLIPGAKASPKVDLIAVASKGKVRYNIDQEGKLGQIAQGMPLLELLRFYRTLSSLQAIAEHPLNARLFFDDLFIAYKEIG